MLNNNPDEYDEDEEDGGDDLYDDEYDYDDDDPVIEHDPDPCWNLNATLRMSKRCPWMY